MQQEEPHPAKMLQLEPLNPWREAALVGMILMELSWILPWFRSLTWITASYPNLPAFLLLGGVFFGATLVARLVNALQLKMKFRQMVMLGFIFLCVLVTTGILASQEEENNLQALVQEPGVITSKLDLMMAGDILVGITTVLIIWRGMVLAREYAGPISVFESMRASIVMLSAYSIIVAGSIHVNPTGYVVQFLASGLLAMVSARIGVLSRLRGGIRHTFDRKWFFGIILAITSILLAALTFAGLLLDQMERLRRALQMIYVLLVTIVAAPLLFILSLLNPKFPTLTLVQPTPTPEGEINMAPNEGLLEQAQKLQDQSFLASLGPYIRLIIVWGVILLAVFILARQFKSWSMGNKEEIDTERQSLLDAGGLRKLLGLNLRKLMNNLGSLSAARFLQPRDRQKAAERIRRIYAYLIETAADLGKPRPEANTPLEYLMVLKTLFPTSDQDLENITNAYLRVRYGELPETQAEVDIVEAAWTRLESLAEEQKKVLKAATRRIDPALV